MKMSYRDSHVISSLGVDKQMRNAYDVWRRHFYESDIESTPAYDVVGLLAALCLHRRRSPHTYFDIGPLGSNKNDEQEGADVYKLKSSYRSKDKLAKLFSDMSSFGNANVKLGIITDFGEECDDEVTCLLADRLHKEGLADVRFLFTTSITRFETQKAKFASWGGSEEFVSSIYEQNDFIDFLNGSTSDSVEEKEFEDSKVILLQIGPIHEPESTSGWRTVWRPKLTCGYDYVVVGTFNGVAALNVKNNARESALHLMRGANTKIVVDTTAGLGAFNFSAGALSALFPPDAAYNSDEAHKTILEHVCKIGWRNSVGRASAFAGCFVAHLVSEPVGSFGGGANYMTIKKIQDDLGGKVVHSDRSNRIAEKYLDQLQNRPGPPPFDFMKLKIKPDGSTNNPNGATVQSILNGYVYILDCLSSYFSVPYEFFESGGPENWKPQWDTPSLYDLSMHGDSIASFAIDELMRVEETA